jgi:hypothetical protein
MGWGASDPVVQGEFAVVKAAIAKIWAWILKIWSVFDKVWGAFRSIWNAVKDLWSYVKPILSNIYNTFIKPVINFVQAVNTRLEQVIGMIDKIYDATLGRIDAVYNLLFGRWEELWGKIEQISEKTARLVSKVDKELAEDIRKTVQDIEDKTIGRIRETKNDLTGYINVKLTEIRDYVNDVRYAIKDLVDPYIKKTVEIEKYLRVSFDRPNLLSRGTVETTFGEYGATAHAIIEGKTRTPAGDDLVDRLDSLDQRTFIDDYLDAMEQGEAGSWGLVAQRIIEGIDEIDRARDIADKHIGPEEWEQDDIFAVERQILQAAIDGEISWLPNWLVWSMEKLGYITSAVRRSWDNWNIRMYPEMYPETQSAEEQLSEAAQRQGVK